MVVFVKPLISQSDYAMIPCSVSHINEEAIGV